MQKTIGVRPNPMKETREKQIKDAALKLFSEKGFHNTTMAEIALTAGLGPCPGMRGFILSSLSVPLREESSTSGHRGKYLSICP